MRRSALFQCVNRANPKHIPRGLREGFAHSLVPLLGIESRLTPCLFIRKDLINPPHEKLGLGNLLFPWARSVVAARVGLGLTPRPNDYLRAEIGICWLS